MINPWTEDRIEDLKRLWAEGVSCSGISRRLGNGITRNAVIGKVTRLKLPKRITITRSPVEMLRRLEGRKQLRQGGIRKRALQPPKLCSVALPSGALPPLNIDVMQLAPQMCRWPVTEDRPHRFCGHACKDEHSPYCSAHMVMAHREEPPKPIEKFADWLTRHEYARAA